MKLKYWKSILDNLASPSSDERNVVQAVFGREFAVNIASAIIRAMVHSHVITFSDDKGGFSCKYSIGNMELTADERMLYPLVSALLYLSDGQEKTQVPRKDVQAAYFVYRDDKLEVPFVAECDLSHGVVCSLTLLEREEGKGYDDRFLWLKDIESLPRVNYKFTIFGMKDGKKSFAKIGSPMDIRLVPSEEEFFTVGSKEVASMYLMEFLEDGKKLLDTKEFDTIECHVKKTKESEEHDYADIILHS